MKRIPSKLVRTAPKRIWLQCGDDPENLRCNFIEMGEVTWCKNSVMASEVEYIRADLVQGLSATKVKPEPPDYADAYQGAREDLAIWKRRALEAESALRTEQKVSSRLAAEVNEANGPTHLGEPVQSERVPLTDLQIDECLPLGVAEYSTLVGADEIRAFARAIEAAHGIKPAE